MHIHTFNVQPEANYARSVFINNSVYSVYINSFYMFYVYKKETVPNAVYSK